MERYKGKESQEVHSNCFWRCNRVINDKLEKIENNNNVVLYFRKAAEQFPEKTAVQYKEKRISYKELDIASNVLAKEIQAKGRQDDNIMLFFEPGIDMVTSILGVLKSGNICVAVDPEHPAERIRGIMKDSDTSLMISNHKNQQGLEKLLDSDKDVVYVDGLENLDYGELEFNPNAKKRAIILYTSGSSGSPKGVIQTHLSLFHNIFNYYTTIKLNETDKVALFTSYSHAVAIIDIFSTLITGGTLHIYNVKEVNSIEKMKDWMKGEKITIYHSVPTLFRAFLDKAPKVNYFDDVRLVVLGGENVSKQDFLLFQEYFPKQSSFVNFLGASEIMVATLNILSYEQEVKENYIAAGNPVNGLQIILLDKQGKQVCDGEKGEIAYKSAYLAEGYLNQEKLTNEKFLLLSGSREERIYRSGDFGVYTEKGTLKYLGREDSQIKLRGIRIELGEIESQIDQLDGINKNVVVVQEAEADEKFLVSFYEACEEGITSEEIRRKLYDKVPLFMIPRYFVKLHKLPLTALGKIDRKYLENYREYTEETYEEPKTELQKMLCEIWESILGRTRIGIQVSYLELGGNSLNAVRIITEIYNRVGIRLSVRDILLYDTISKIEKYLKEVQCDTDIEYKEGAAFFEELPSVGEDSSYFPLSNAQKRMYALYEMEPDATTYNTPIAYRIQGKIEKEKLEAAFQLLVQRHGALRTVFLIHEGEVVQVVRDSGKFYLEYIEDISTNIDEILDQFIRPFDLQQAPLIRAVLIRTDKEEYILAYDIHHIVSDGTSAEIIISELAKYYNGESIEPLKYQFRNYVAWQKRVNESEEYQKHKNFWIEQLSEAPALNFPLDFPRPATQSFRGRSIREYIDSEILSNLKRIACMENVTLYMVLLASFQIVLSKYASQIEIVLGTPVAGRENVNLTDMVGMFVNTIVMKNKVLGDRSFHELLTEVRENALSAYENQDYQFDDLVNDLNIERDPSRNPVFDVMFVLENMERTEHQFGNAQLTSYHINSKTSKFEMCLIATETGDKIEFQFEYCMDLLREETARNILQHYLILLHQIAQQPNRKIYEYSMMTAEEKEIVLHKFNATKSEYPRDKSVAEVFEEQVKKTPDNTALVYRGSKVSYAELNAKADIVARILSQKGVKENVLVGIVTDNSIEMIIGILGDRKNV